MPLPQAPARVMDMRRQQRPSHEQVSRPPRRSILRRPMWLVAVIGVFALLIVGGAVLFVSRQPADGLTAAQAVEKAVSRHYLLPAGEQPALATVEDQTQLTTPFLKQAKNGDEILIYAKAGLVIIYRPSMDRIVATGPVVFDGSGSPSGTAP